MTYAVGDELAFQYGHGGWKIAKIERITPSGRIICGGYTLNPSLTIRGLSNTYCPPFRGQPVTDEIREAVRRQKALIKVGRINWDIMPTGLILSVITQVEAINAPASEANEQQE